MKLECKKLEFGSNEQLKSIELRREILRVPLKLDFSEEELAQEKEQIHIGCYNEMELIGILLLVPKTNGYLKMRQVAVSKAMQGKGVGKFMVNFSEEWAIKNNYTTIELNARKTAVPFYLSMNYTIIGNEFLEVGLPHLRMEKVI